MVLKELIFNKVWWFERTHFYTLGGCGGLERNYFSTQFILEKGDQVKWLTQN